MTNKGWQEGVCYQIYTVLKSSEDVKSLDKLKVPGEDQYLTARRNHLEEKPDAFLQWILILWKIELLNLISFLFL